MVAWKRIKKAVGLTLLAAGSRTSGQPARLPDTLDFVEALPMAVVKNSPNSPVVGGTFDVGGEKRVGIFMHAEGSAEFPSLEVKEDSVLSFSVGIRTDAWDKDGDGVEFQVHLKNDAGANVTLFSQYVDAKHIPKDRRWTDLRIKLWPFAGTMSRITLVTLTGPKKDAAFDWAVWGKPRVELAGR